MKLIISPTIPEVKKKIRNFEQTGAIKQKTGVIKQKTGVIKQKTS